MTDVDLFASPASLRREAGIEACLNRRLFDALSVTDDQSWYCRLSPRGYCLTLRKRSNHSVCVQKVKSS